MYHEKENNLDNELEEKKLIQDIRRTIILGAYMKEWGMPEQRVLSYKETDVIEMYSFPPSNEKNIWRVATVGMSGVKNELGTQNNFEFLMALTNAVGKVTFQELANFLMDLFAHSQQVSVSFEPEKTIPETHLMPSAISPKAVLLDEPRAESPELEAFTVGKQEVKLLWVIPVYGEEQNLIVEKGIHAFDLIQEKSEVSLADISRPSLVIKTSET